MTGGRVELGGGLRGARMDFNYFIRALMDVRRATAISAGPLATAFYTRSLSFAGFLEPVYKRERWVEIGIL